MPAKTLIFIFVLSILATLLLGINVGKKISLLQNTDVPLPTPLPDRQAGTFQPLITPTLIPSPTLFVEPTSFVTSTSQSSTRVTVKNGVSTFTDEACGFSFSYTGTFLKSNTQDGKSSILTDPDNPEAVIAATCEKEIPKPPLPAEKIEDITLDGIFAKLYHDQSSKDGSPRDEIIVKHPTNNLEIIVAGYGPSFDEAISTFKFR